MADEKILKDEQLNFDELENVAGGTHKQTYDDMKFLYDKFQIQWPENWDRAVGQLGSLYYEAGMRLDTSEDRENKYYLRTSHGEVKIDRYAARDRLAAYLGRY